MSIAAYEMGLADPSRPANGDHPDRLSRSAWPAVPAFRLASSEEESVLGHVKEGDRLEHLQRPR
jgi:hypothetical protein